MKPSSLKNKARIQEILAQIGRFSEGNYNHYLGISDSVDELDAISAGLNALGEILKGNENKIGNKEKRISNLLDILLDYTVMDFSEKATITEEGDEIDALCAGVNALGEELVYNTEKLLESEALIKTIFKNAPDAIVAIDSQNRIISWNPIAEKVFGWKEEEIKNRALSDIIVPERYREKHKNGLNQFLQQPGEGTILNRAIEMPALRRDNTEIEMELTISPARLKNDYIFISFLRDITERKKTESKIKQLNSTLEQKVAERTESLQQSEKKYRYLFENNPMPLWILDLPTLRFRDVNQSAINHYGYSRQEFLSMTATDIRPEEDKIEFLNIARKNGATKSGVWRHLKKDGTIIHADVTAHPIVFDGKPCRLILSVDVTEKKKAQEALIYSEERFRRIFDSRLIGFLFWNPDGKITEANGLFLEMTGYTLEDIRSGNVSLNNITPPEYAERVIAARKQIALSGACEPYEKEYIRKDGSRFPVLVGAAALHAGPYSERVSYILDITLSKRLREEIIELNKDLEQRVVKRTAELEMANKELEAFSYSVSHDLRAPLRAIHGYSQILSEDYESKLDAEGIKVLNSIKFNAKKMGHLVDDLLEFSRMGKRTMTMSQSDLNEIVKEVLNDMDLSSKDRAGIMVHPLGEVKADAVLLQNVFQNLISNAVKYSSKKENPTVEIGVQEIKGVRCYFVKDNGAGFDMAYYNKLFGVFQRLHQQEDFEGTGVGLAIVQRIIHRHGGKIWAESKPGKGATFFFTLDNSN